MARRKASRRKAAPKQSKADQLAEVLALMKEHNIEVAGPPGKRQIYLHGDTPREAVQRVAAALRDGLFWGEGSSSD